MRGKHAEARVHAIPMGYLQLRGGFFSGVCTVVLIKISFYISFHDASRLVDVARSPLLPCSRSCSRVCFSYLRHATSGDDLRDRDLRARSSRLETARQSRPLQTFANLI